MWAATATLEAQFDLRRGCGGSPPPPATGAQHGWCGAGSALDGDACGPAYEDGGVFLTRSCADRADSGGALFLQHDSALCAWTTPPAQQYKILHCQSVVQSLFLPFSCYHLYNINKKYKTQFNFFITLLVTLLW